MAQSSPPAPVRARQYDFGPYRLEAGTRALYRGADFIALTPKAAELLLLLVENAGHVVTKEEILERVWPGVVIEEGGIANIVSSLRKALGGDFGAEGPIATLSRRGYRFTVPVRSGDTGGTPMSPSNPPPLATEFAADVIPVAPEAAGSAPSIVQRDPILVADIENKTGEAVFDGTLREALLLHLAQSPFLDVLGDRKVQGALAMMGKAGAPVVGEVALEVCQRTGAGAAITGSVFSLGEDYGIGLYAIHAETGDLIVSEQARANGKGEVLRALDVAALRLRSKLGESRASLTRHAARFDEVATASLEALRAYTMGRREWFERGDAAALPHQARAIELDPQFASAYSAIAIASNNLGQTERAVGYITQAYALRDRVGERERCRIMASYHHIATGDLHRAHDVQNTWMREYPRDATAHVNGGSMLMELGQWEKARQVTEVAMRMDPHNIPHSNMAIILMALGRLDEARATIEAAFARGLDAYYLHLDAYQLAFLRGDDAAMAREVDAVMGRQAEEDFLIATQADTEAFHGRLDRARALSARAAESALRAGVEEMSAVWLALAAMREAELGFPDLARTGARAALERSQGRVVRCLAAYTLARCGEAEGAALAEDLDRDCPEATAVQRYWLPCIRATIALAAGKPEDAVRSLEPAAAGELGLVVPFEYGMALPVYLRGLAHAAAGRDDEARREFARIESRPGLLKNSLIRPLAAQASARLRPPQ